jgi:hypothetical protein
MTANTERYEGADWRGSPFVRTNVRDPFFRFALHDAVNLPPISRKVSGAIDAGK